MFDLVMADAAREKGVILSYKLNKVGVLQQFELMAISNINERLIKSQSLGTDNNTTDVIYLASGLNQLHTVNNF